jgi:hypothetical protein
LINVFKPGEGCLCGGIEAKVVGDDAEVSERVEQLLRICWAFRASSGDPSAIHCRHLAKADVAPFAYSVPVRLAARLHSRQVNR